MKFPCTLFLVASGPMKMPSDLLPEMRFLVSPPNGPPIKLSLLWLEIDTPVSLGTAASPVALVPMRLPRT